MKQLVRRQALPLLAVLSLVPSFVASPAAAANCGGAVQCNCGDTVTSSWNFNRNLSCGGTGPGLVIGANGVVLDGLNTYGITGTGSGQLHKGIVTQAFDNTVIKRLTVTGFNWGINAEQFATGTLIDDVTVQSALDEGIHLGENSSNTTIQNSDIINNATENLYVINSNGNTVTSCQIGGTGVGIRIDGGDDNTFTNNVIDQRVEFAAGASGNCFGARNGSGACISAANQLTARFQFRNSSSGNNVIGATINSPGSSCVQFQDSSNNNFVRATLQSCASGNDMRVESSGTNTFHKGQCSNPDPAVNPSGSPQLIIDCCTGACC